MATGEGERSPLVQMRRGLVEHCVLALLRGEDKYAVELVQTLVRHGLIAGEGTIYPLLSRLRKRGLVTTTWRESASGPPRRYYGLSPEGVAATDRFAADWVSLSRSVSNILQGEGGST